MRFGLFVPQGWRLDLAGIAPSEHWATMRDLAQAADAGPFESIWVYDHFHTIPVPTEEATHEAWSLMSAFAAATTRVRLGQMCTCMGYRNPAYLAKVAATVDVISGGRVEMGIGAGWYEHEWRAYGYGFPEPRARMRMFREACEIITRMWTEDEPTFHGEHYTIDQPINEPKGVRKPHPSFWIGGSGEQVTLKLVARFADACNFAGDPETLRRKYDILRGHCETVGRDFESITRSSNRMLFPLKPGEDPRQATERAREAVGATYEEYLNTVEVGTPEQLVERLQPVVDAGVNYLIAYIPEVAYDHDRLHLYAEEIIPHIR
jgi:F420-dependent oxidoreductase-like protein